MREIAVVGAGLAGLTAAYRLAERGHGVTIFEAQLRTGGQVHTELIDGFVIEHGAEGFVARSEAVPALATDLGLGDELADQLTTRSYVYDGSMLQALAAGEAAAMLGFQVPREDLGKGIRTLRRGMGSLVWALEGTLRPRVVLRLGVTVDAIDFGDRVVLSCGGEQTDVDAVVWATESAAATRVLPNASQLARSRTLSSFTVSLRYSRRDVSHPLDATGFVIAAAAQRDGLRACAFVTSKFADRAPPEQVLLRLFFRPDAGELDSPDSLWIDRARRCCTEVLGAAPMPDGAWVSRWPHALPVLDADHREAVADLEAALRDRPVALAGSAFHGAGIDAAVRSAEAAVDRVE